MPCCSLAVQTPIYCPPSEAQHFGEVLLLIGNPMRAAATSPPAQLPTKDLAASPRHVRGPTVRWRQSAIRRPHTQPPRSHPERSHSSSRSGIRAAPAFSHPQASTTRSTQLRFAPASATAAGVAVPNGLPAAAEARYPRKPRLWGSHPKVAPPRECRSPADGCLAATRAVDKRRPQLEARHRGCRSDLRGRGRAPT